ncbi:hypothetical protein [Methanospirillum sp.]|uniref:hypothetical protein n=1 Tax=Methanospirillum sp. TaxID=45200 RepID=UPI00359F3C6A
MTSYNPTPAIISESFDILRFIGDYANEHESPHSPNPMVLIGGWAVHVYNPWFGSLDIDLIASNNTRESLKHYLKKDLGFETYRLPYTTASTVCKKSSEGQLIIIDFATYEKDQLFEGSEENLSFKILHQNNIIRAISSDISIRVPTRSVLLIFKLKAAWDRNFRIEKGTSHDAEWEKGKLIKDYGDILALLDPSKGGREIMIEIVGNYLFRYSFLKECFYRLVQSDEPFEFYRGMSPEQGKRIVADLLEMVE